MTLALITLAGAAFLAFANGANDVSKGVATLAGTGRTSYRTAIAWGTLWTFAGAAASLVVAVGLVKAFTSAIVTSDVLSASTFPLAVAVGAAVWVLFAARVGLPVSTTHALTGAIVGVALALGGYGSVNWWVLLSTIAAPLALSPVVSGAIAYATHGLAGRLLPACVCVRDELRPSVVNLDGSVTADVAPQLVASVSGCAPADVAEGEPTWRLMPAGSLHWGTAAALSFARGVNDNAKLAALAAVGVSALGTGLWAAFAVTAVAMTLGSYIAGFRVTQTLGERVVDMDQDTGLAASLVAAGLVLAASFYTLPVSTTHVATGAIVGAGVRQGGNAVAWRRVGELVLAWVGTLPIAAAFAAVAAWLIA